MEETNTTMRAVILFLCIFPISVFGTDSCNNPNGSWKQHGQHYYWFIGSKFSYANARAECEKISGGQLAEIQDKATLLLFHDELHAIGEGNYVRFLHNGLKCVDICTRGK